MTSEQIRERIADLHVINIICTHLCFRATFSTYSTLCSNIILNDFTDRISAFPTALSHKTGADHFLITTPNSGSSGHSLKDLASTRLTDSCGKTRSVLTMTLDHFCFTLKFPVPGYLKIVVDGHDFEVLLGARQLLQDGRIRGITVEKG
jgi:FkbM family methyltransferase